MLLLASASPRRRELLFNAGFAFEVLSVPVAEDPLPGESAAALVRRLAALKARAAFTPPPSSIRASPISPPTIRFWFSAPTQLSQWMIKSSASPPAPPTPAACCACSPAAPIRSSPPSPSSPRSAEESATESTAVTFASLSDDEIAAYVATGEPMDKAGAYAIQGYAGRWIPRIRGCYFNVVGLPIALVTSIVEGMTARSRETVGSLPVLVSRPGVSSQAALNQTTSAAPFASNPVAHLALKLLLISHSREPPFRANLSHDIHKPRVS